MAKRVSSRLARRRGKTIARQSVTMIVLAIAGSLIFLFVIVPQLVQLFFRFFGGSDLGLDLGDTVPPQVPIVSPLPEATAESSITIEGFGEADSQVVFKLNGREVEQVEVNQQGEFSYPLALEEGENIVVLYGVDEAGNESTGRQFVIALDTEAPSLAFEALEDGQEAVGKNSQNFVIRGETEPGSTLTLNDRSAYVNLDGTFSITHYLQEGDNTLKFVVTDKAGNSTDREVKVSFKL